MSGDRLRWVALLLSGGLVYGLAVEALGRLPARARAEPELLVSLPPAVAVLMSGGDRHLAGNLSTIRVLIADTRNMAAADYAVQARLQQDIALLKPTHLDNYYVAVAILPWNGQLEATQRILARAAAARPFDYQPLFYYGFHQYHFLRQPAEAAATLMRAAEAAHYDRNRWQLQDLAARWAERGYSAGAAAQVVRAMADTSGPGAFHRYLSRRAQRLEGLARLEGAAARFRDTRGRPPASLDELVVAGLLDAIPVDPLGFGYGLAPGGEPILKSNPQGRMR